MCKCGLARPMYRCVYSVSSVKNGPDEEVNICATAIWERKGSPDLHNWKWRSVCLIFIIRSLVFAFFLSNFFTLSQEALFKPEGSNAISTVCACASVQDRERQRGCNWWRCVVLCLLNACSWLVSDWFHMAPAAGWLLLRLRHSSVPSV